MRNQPDYHSPDEKEIDVAQSHPNTIHLRLKRRTKKADGLQKKSNESTSSSVNESELFELEHKPKAINISAQNEAGASCSISSNDTGECSGELITAAVSHSQSLVKENVAVVYQSPRMNGNSISVLFVGSSSKLNSSECRNINDPSPKRR